MVFRHINRQLASAAVVGSVLGVALVAPRAANAQRTNISTLFYSGVTNAGTSAATSGNVADLHYFLVDDPLNTVSAGSPGSLYVTTKGSFAGRDSWLDDSVGNGVSRWLEPTSSSTTNHLAGTYTYRTTFNLSGFDASSAILSLKMAVDDSVIVRVNGTAVTGVTANSPSSFSSAATINSSNATFLSGLNTIDFVVTNNGGLPVNNPVGLRVEASGTAIVASAAPEPGALSLMAMGLVSAGGGSVVVRKRRAKKA